MHDVFYRDMIMIPSGRDEKVGESLMCSMFFLQTLERLRLVDVKNIAGGKPHNIVSIMVDDVFIDEDVENWVGRFG